MAIADLEIDFDNRRIHVKGIDAPYAQGFGDEPAYLRPPSISCARSSCAKKIEPNPAEPKCILAEPWVGHPFGVSAEIGEWRP